MSRLVAVLALCLVLAGCATDEEPSARPTSTAPATSTPTANGTPDQPPHPVSVQALIEKEYDGHGLRLVRELASTDAYRQHSVTWQGNGLTLSGVLDVPRGPGPHPVVVLAHGYIDPAIYTNGRGMKRELDWFARHGYVALHVDYRGHAFSSPAPRANLNLRLGYTEDVINAVLALQAWDGPVEPRRIALVGRSMGGSVVYNALVARPGLVDAAVVFAPVSSDAGDNFNRWVRRDPGRSDVAGQVLEAYGAPEANPAFWANASPRRHFGRITEPVMIHHGTLDESCPIAWSRETARLMEAAGVDVRLHVYEGEQHAFGPQWPLSMERTTAFLARRLT